MKKSRSLKFAVGGALVGLGLTGCPGEKDPGPTINVAPVPEEPPSAEDLTPTDGEPQVKVNTTHVPPEDEIPVKAPDDTTDVPAEDERKPVEPTPGD